ncbi:MAG: ribose-5-phosphate isomerase RpiA [Deltaproteobacteria bacterium]|nr:ribose-5-phosphate isomerase RpiA [Deltaproteobacteria bacterium]
MTDPAGQAKRLSGAEAARLVKEGAVVGLGTGSTASHAIQELGRRIREEGLHLVGIPTSYQAADLARRNGIILQTLDDVDRVDIAIDGADEVDPHKNLIKGGGAAHTREKVIDSLADLLVIVVDDSKLVGRLGEKSPIPLEVIPMAVVPVMRRLEAMGGQPAVRIAVEKDGPVVTDQGNLVIDVRFPMIEDPETLESALNDIPGVVENGLFIGLADLVIVGDRRDGTIRRIE